MEKEKFDRELAAKILINEEISVPVFNRDKVWRKSTGNRDRKNLAVIIYIAATVLFALNILWNSDIGNKVTKKPDKKRDKIAKAVEPAIPSAIQKQSSVILKTKVKNKPSQLLSDNIKTADLPAVAQLNPSPDQPQSNPEISVDQLPKATPVMAKTVGPVPVVEEVRVTFIHGDTEPNIPPSVLRAAFKRGDYRSSDLSEPVADPEDKASRKKLLKLTFKPSKQ